MVREASGTNTNFLSTTSTARRSLIELIILKEIFGQLVNRNSYAQNSQLQLNQLLLDKVVQDACHWVRVSSYLMNKISMPVL